MEVEVSGFTGNRVVMVVELGEVAISVVEVKTDNGMVGAIQYCKVISLQLN